MDLSKNIESRNLIIFRKQIYLHRIVTSIDSFDFQVIRIKAIHKRTIILIGPQFQNCECHSKTNKESFPSDISICIGPCQNPFRISRRRI